MNVYQLTGDAGQLVTLTVPPKTDADNDVRVEINDADDRVGPYERSETASLIRACRRFHVSIRRVR